MYSPIVSVIAAYADDGGYGFGEREMPWPRGGIPGDLPNFYIHTTDAPKGKKNLLVGGHQTVTSMGNLTLGESRVLVGVSRSMEVGGGYGPNRYIVRSIEDVFVFAQSYDIDVHRIIFVGGETLWLYGMDVADEAHITIAHRACGDDPRIKWLKRPLHEIARENGMTLVKREQFSEPEGSSAWPWAKSHERQIWRRRR